MQHPELLLGAWPEHELLDSGEGMKLERFGEVLLARSEPKAWWKRCLGRDQWERAHGRFTEEAKWHWRKPPPESWALPWNDVRFVARVSASSKHVGLFPEQDPHWRWIREKLAATPGASMLNLFGYTGAATLVAAASGASVTHVDSSKPAIAAARASQVLSGLDGRPVRWILDDAMKFVQREARRKSRYDAVCLDPPSFGRGPNREIWKVEEQIFDLLSLCAGLLSDRPRFLLLTMYNLEASSLMLGNLLRDALPRGAVSVGELGLEERRSGRILPLSLYARWEA